MTAGGTFGHALTGRCGCGTSHGLTDDTTRLPIPSRLTRYEIKDSLGNLRAIHARKDTRDGKQMWWERPDGEKGLGGQAIETLPLYGSHRLTDWPKGSTIVICEGEKATEALWALGCPAVGTVTGAKSIPDKAALAPLLDYSPVLWPDNDEDGRLHMTRLASRSTAAGVTVRMLEWKMAPPKGDAGEFEGTASELEELIKAACAFEQTDTVSLADLLRDLAALIRRYVVIGDAEVTAISLWVAHTWVFEAADTTPYLNITSAEKQSGKTLLLELLENLTKEPWLTGRVTTAALVRKIEAESPTLLLDESDAAFGVKEYGETLRGILNLGYKRGGVVSLVSGQGAGMFVKDHHVFCPKAIAGIKDLPDTVADRSITIAMKRKRPDEKVQRFRRRIVVLDCAPIRSRLQTWSGTAVESLDDAIPELLDELSDRAMDVWEPLLGIADTAGTDWAQAARDAARALSSRGAREDQSLGVRLLRDVKDVFLTMGNDRVQSADLATRLASREESPWSDWKAKPFDASALAKLLRPYAIRPHQVRFGERTLKGYLSADFADTWARYVPETTETRETTPTERRDEQRSVSPVSVVSPLASPLVREAIALGAEVVARR